MIAAKFDMIAFDADDTLWHSEIHYTDAQMQFAEMLLPYGVSKEATLAVLHEIEIANLPNFGYGIKGFVLSMLETGVRVTQERLSGADTQRIIDLARWMLAHELRLIEGVKEVVTALAAQTPLMVITKGDLIDQERKLQGSGLAEFFLHVEVVSEKNEGVYRAILKKHDLRPERFLMVGNSMPSDVLPVIALGGWGVHVPYHQTWAHETTQQAPAAPERFRAIERMADLPDLLRAWE